MKTVLITGANRGIGLALAHNYKQRGWKVYGTARKPEEAANLKKVVDHVLKLDVSSIDSIKLLSQKLDDAAIDLLINNAGFMSRANFDSLDADVMLQEYKVNALGPLFLSKALLPSLRKTANPRIVNITSRVGSMADNGSGGNYGYRASKAALNSISKSWSIDFKDVPVLLIHPGFVDTGMTTGYGASDKPADVADKIIAIMDEFTEKSHEESKWKSGQFLHRDGYELPW